MIMRVRLLVDVMISDRDIVGLQAVVGEQPTTAVLIEGQQGWIHGRFMGATMVEKEEGDAGKTR